MEALGRTLDIVPTADAIEVNMALCGGVTFICVGADTYTIQECTNAAGAGAANLLAIDRYFTNAGAVGATSWVLVNVGPPNVAAVVVAANAAIHVDSGSLSAGFTYLRCSSTAAGLVYAIIHDLRTERRPDLLVAPAL